jgi:hypothetical protein
LKSESTVPDDLRRFILTSVPSVAYLEAILLLRKSPPGGLTAAAVGRGLYVPETRAVELLEQLQANGIAQVGAVAEPPAFQYVPQPELAVMLDRLAEAYAADLVGVTDLIHSGVGKRAYQFADAFRWRKDT